MELEDSDSPSLAVVPERSSEEMHENIEEDRSMSIQT
jgi:hypothetical protein